MTRAETLDQAKVCVCGQRETDYGSPEDNFKTIADLWSAYKKAEFTPVDVAMMMSLLKIARIASGTGTDDSFVDLAGYAACGAEIAAGNREEEKPEHKRGRESSIDVKSRQIGIRYWLLSRKHLRFRHSQFIKERNHEAPIEHFFTKYKKENA